MSDAPIAYMPDPEAIKEIQNRREIHAQRSEERQKFSHGFLIAGTGILVGILAAAEQTTTEGRQPNLYLHWLIPFLIIALWAFDSRFRLLGARAEELMQRLCEKQTEWSLGAGRMLHRRLAEFRDEHIQYYSLKSAYWWSTRFILALTAVPLILMLGYSVINVSGGRAPVPPLPWVISDSLDVVFRVAWTVTAAGSALAGYAVREWRRVRFTRANHILDTMCPLEIPEGP